MPSKLRNKRKKNKDYNKKRRSGTNTPPGVPLSESSETDTDGENKGMNFTQYEKFNTNYHLVARTSGIQMNLTNVQGFVQEKFTLTPIEFRNTE